MMIIMMMIMIIMCKNHTYKVNFQERKLFLPFTIIANSHMSRVSPSGHLECVKWLVANRASLSAEDQLGRTALALAEEYQHKDVAAFIQTCIEESRDPNSSLYAMRSSRRGCV